MPHSPLQKLQKARAYFKFVITGMFKPVQTTYLTEYEVSLWREILDIREKLIIIHDGNSRELGLNVPLMKCTEKNCRKEAMYRIDMQWVCEKHFKQIENETK